MQVASIICAWLKDPGSVQQAAAAAATAQKEMRHPYDVLGLAEPGDVVNEALILVSPNNRPQPREPEEHESPCGDKLAAVQALLCRCRAPVVLIDPDLEALVVPQLDRPVRPMLIADFVPVATVTVPTSDFDRRPKMKSR